MEKSTLSVFSRCARHPPHESMLLEPGLCVEWLVEEGMGVVRGQVGVGCSKVVAGVAYEGDTV